MCVGNTDEPMSHKTIFFLVFNKSHIATEFYQNRTLGPPRILQSEWTICQLLYVVVKRGTLA
jgi:hypothetical protein